MDLHIAVPRTARLGGRRPVGRTVLVAGLLVLCPAAFLPAAGPAARAAEGADATEGADPAARKPNFVVIFIDDK